MSVVSSRVSSVSSILKAPGVRPQLIRQNNRVCFKLPKNLQNIIYNFEIGSGSKDYEDLICTLRQSNIKDKDLVEFLSDVRQCISLLGPLHKVFIEALLQIPWTDRPVEVTSTYKAFLEDLICMQIYYAKFVIDNLVERFKPEADDKEWEDGECTKEEVMTLNHVHDVLRKVLNIVPMSSKLLLQSLRSRFPYIIHGSHVHEVYIYALLQILEYAPQLRSDILSLIINRLMVLDVNIPRLQSESDEEELLDDSECDIVMNVENVSMADKCLTETNTIHPMAHTLDVCMELILRYIHNSCFVNGILQVESLKCIYLDVLLVFETVILPTHASQYVQYIMFYMCSFKTAIVEAFTDWLWRKVCDPNVPSIIRQSSISYIASLLGSATFVPSWLVKAMQSKMAKWIHGYIATQDSVNYMDVEAKENYVFYSVCQALFFLIIKRHKDFIDSKRSMLSLQELDLTKIVSSRLNPLKACQPEIVHNFADITRTYQLAYCYTIIESNMRSHLPILNSDSRFASWIDCFFPFGLYTLPQSGQRIIPLLYENIGNGKYGLAGKYEAGARHTSE